MTAAFTSLVQTQQSGAAEQRDNHDGNYNNIDDSGFAVAKIATRSDFYHIPS